MFGSFVLERDYYYHEGKKQRYYPADAALGLESGHTPALTRLICLEGADEISYQKAEQHLAETGGIHVCGRKIQRMVQRVGSAAQTWQSGMFWSKPCAEKMLALRCIHANRTLKAFWKDRLTSHLQPHQYLRLAA